MAAPPPNLSPSNVKLKWGPIELIATGISYSRTASGEIDFTNINSTILEDPAYTDRKVLKKRVEFGVVDLGELSVEFFGPGGFDDTYVGMKKILNVTGNNVSTFPLGVPAYLVAISVQAAAGEMVRGNCTFRLSAA